MKTVNNSTLNTAQINYQRNDLATAISLRVSNVRPCPNCDNKIYGMPGGMDALCRNCGFKDPCCSD